MESGLIAAEVLRSAAGDYRRERLEPYRRRLNARFGRRVARSWGGQIPLGWKRRLAGSLMAWRWFARHVVVDRWFLRAYEAALEPGDLGARGT